MVKAERQFWQIYIIEADDQKLYTGITLDIVRRWSEHSNISGDKSRKGAKFFRGREPKKLLYLEQADNRSLASQKEYQIKKLSRANKLALIDTSSNALYQLAQENLKLIELLNE